MIKQLIATAKRMVREGFFHIFGSSVLAQVGSLLSSMIVIRNLPKAEYGYYVNAQNLYSYFQIILGLGLANAVLQYCSERVSEQRKNSIYRFSLTHGMFANVIICLAIVGLSFAKRAQGSSEIAYYLLMMAFLPFVVYLYNYFQLALRVRFHNREYSYANMVFSVVSLVGNVVLTAIFSIPGLIISTYLSYSVGAFFSYMPLHKEAFLSQIFQPQNTLNRAEKTEVTHYSLTCALTNLASAALVLLDVTCLDLVLADSAVLADYKVASTIPTALSFIPTSMITFFYPRIVDSFSEGKENGFSYVRQLVKIYAVVNGFFYACLALGAPLIIGIIFGKKYLNIIPIFQILSVNYLAYSVRSLLGNVIAAIKKVKMNLYFSIISGVVNIGLNVLLINLMGSVGAAISTLAVTILIGSASAVYLHHYRVTDGN